MLVFRPFPWRESLYSSLSHTLKLGGAPDIFNRGTAKKNNKIESILLRRMEFNNGFFYCEREVFAAAYAL